MHIMFIIYNKIINIYNLFPNIEKTIYGSFKDKSINRLIKQL